MFPRRANQVGVDVDARHLCRERMLGDLDRDDAAVAPDVEDALAPEPLGRHEGESLVWSVDSARGGRSNAARRGHDGAPAGVVAAEVAVRGRGAVALAALGPVRVRRVGRGEGS